MELFEQMAALRREGQSFALATVVARRAPVSAHLGDRAIVFADGRMEGFVGGACSREIIRRQALDALATRCSRLVSIRPDASDAAESTGEHVVVPMTCVSEGAIDVYVEPFVQPRRLVIVGATPVAESLARLARSMNYDVVRAVEGHERRDIEREAETLGVTVVTLDALEAILRESVPGQLGSRRRSSSRRGTTTKRPSKSILACGVPYVGLVASTDARGGGARTARGSRRARRRNDPESGGARSGRADAARGGAVHPRGNRPGASERHARGGAGATRGRGGSALGAGDGRRSGVRDECDDRLGAADGGS